MEFLEGLWTALAEAMEATLGSGMTGAIGMIMMPLAALLIAPFELIRLLITGGW